mmetsp:Transcript_53068/g.106542  ORF Transcript_53068/g.106542 Transcript_53068/m.106542 type:complete len:346 (+) Transcript_53068:182-1219(+)
MQRSCDGQRHRRGEGQSREGRGRRAHGSSLRSSPKLLVGPVDAGGTRLRVGLQDLLVLPVDLGLAVDVRALLPLVVGVRRAHLAHLGPGLSLELLGLALLQEDLPAGGPLVPVLLELPLLGVLLPARFLGLFGHLLVPLHVGLHDGVGVGGGLGGPRDYPLALPEDLLVELVALHVQGVLPFLGPLLVLLLPLLPHVLLRLDDDAAVLVLVIGVLGIVVRLHQDLEGLGRLLQLALVRVDQDGEFSVLLGDLGVRSLRADHQHLIGRAVPLLGVIPGGGQALDDLLGRAGLLLDLLHLRRLDIAHLADKCGEQRVHAIVVHGAPLSLSGNLRTAGLSDLLTLFEA